jgi:hypothetical protein
VKADGSGILAQSGGITINAHSSGAYVIDFPDPVEGHGIFTTLLGTGFGTPQVCGDTPDAALCVGPPTDINDGHHVVVHTWDDASGAADRAFYITSLP